MFEQFTDRMEIRDIANLWSKEIGETASLVESTLVEFFRKRAAKRDGLEWPGEGLLIDMIATAIDVNLEVSRDDIREFCEHAEMPGPRFWFGRDSVKIVSVGRCREWLRKLVASAKNGKPVSKKAIFENARAELGDGLSRRSFDEVWAEVVPNDWKSHGRPKKS